MEEKEKQNARRAGFFFYASLSDQQRETLHLMDLSQQHFSSRDGFWISVRVFGVMVITTPAD